MRLPTPTRIRSAASRETMTLFGFPRSCTSPSTERKAKTSRKGSDTEPQEAENLLYPNEGSLLVQQVPEPKPSHMQPPTSTPAVEAMTRSGTGRLSHDDHFPGSYQSSFSTR